MTPRDRSEYVKDLARQVGFDRCGIARAEPIGRAPYVRDWLAAGRHGTMGYLGKNTSLRADPSQLIDSARSVVVVAMNYCQPQPDPQTPEKSTARGRVARYAWGEDYHRVVKDKLHAMADRMRVELSEPFEVKACVDTVPILERELAAAAGIGWIGKNTMVLDPDLGSYFFLGELVTTLEIEADSPSVDHCGTCTACLEACPTKAFPAPYEMDASRCISYLTIEHRSDIDESFHESMGDWIFGCDICQEVCPHNRTTPSTTEPRFAIRPPSPTPDLSDLLTWSIEDYREQLSGSSMKRAKLEMLQRNAQIARRNVEAGEV